VLSSCLRSDAAADIPTHYTNQKPHTSPTTPPSLVEP
jgi:hypothetical protein